MDCWQTNMLKWPNVATVFTGCHYRIIKQYITKAFPFFSLTNRKVIGACRFFRHRESCSQVQLLSGVQANYLWYWGDVAESDPKKHTSGSSHLCGPSDYQCWGRRVSAHWSWTAASVFCCRPALRGSRWDYCKRKFKVVVRIDLTFYFQIPGFVLSVSPLVY